MARVEQQWSANRGHVRQERIVTSGTRCVKLKHACYIRDTRPLRRQFFDAMPDRSLNSWSARVTSPPNPERDSLEIGAKP